MSNGKTSAEERIAILERRDEESRRTIRALSEMLSRAMDRIEELQGERRSTGMRTRVLRSLSAPYAMRSTSSRATRPSSTTSPCCASG